MRTVMRGGAVRFLAGVATVFALWFPGAKLVLGKSFAPTGFVGVLNLALCLTAGFVVALGLLRPSLHAAAGIEGRRSVITGLIATWILVLADSAYQVLGFGSGMLYSHEPSRGVVELIAFVTGSVTTFIAFRSWLREGDREVEDLTTALDGLKKSPAKTDLGGSH